MTVRARPLRSVLYVPGSRPGALAKLGELQVDAVILDLEDAVLTDAKAAARQTVVETLSTNDFGQTLCLVRVNGLDTAFGENDVRAISGLPCDGIVLPKVSEGAAVVAATKLTTLPIWAMIETPLGVLNVGDIAGMDPVVGMILGTNDLAVDLHCTPADGRAALMAALQNTLLAARAHGKICIDGVYNAFRDLDGFTKECEQGRALGFDGKSLIHPMQIAPANAVFSPTEDELDLAQRQVAAFNAAREDGQGVAVLDGRIVEQLHIVAAQALLERHQRILQQES